MPVFRVTYIDRRRRRSEKGAMRKFSFMNDYIVIAGDMIIVIDVIFNRLRDIKYCLNELFDLSR